MQVLRLFEDSRGAFAQLAARRQADMDEDGFRPTDVHVDKDKAVARGSWSPDFTDESCECG
jgi:hypothetical protein